MKNLALVAGAVLAALVSFASDASAQRRCGDFIQNGTIYVASRARDCNRGTAWHRDQSGRRVWGSESHGRVYYHGRARSVAHQHRGERYTAYSSSAASASRSAVVTGAPAAPVQAPASSCPRVNAMAVQNTVCRPNDRQYSWRGQNNWCLADQPSPNSYTCFNQNTKRLAWYTP